MATFETLEDYNHHTLLKDVQNGFKQKKTRTSMDSVRNKFVNKMKKSSITNILSEPAENLVNQN